MDKKSRKLCHELLETSVGELRFEKTRAEKLLQEVREIAAVTDDPLAKRMAEMAIEIYHLDGIRHNRLIFGNK